MTLTQYLEEWNEACAYAHECVPDMPLAHAPGPFFALASIAAVCFLLWRRNERALQRQHAAEAEYALHRAAEGAKELQRALECANERPAVAPFAARHRAA